MDAVDRVRAALNAHDVQAFVVQEETMTGRGEHERHVAVYQLENGRVKRERLFA